MGSLPEDEEADLDRVEGAESESEHVVEAEDGHAPPTPIRVPWPCNFSFHVARPWRITRKRHGKAAGEGTSERH